MFSLQQMEVGTQTDNRVVSTATKAVQVNSVATLLGETEYQLYHSYHAASQLCAIL